MKTSKPFPYAATLEEVAHTLNMSTEGVRVVQQSALRKLRRALARKGLPPSVMIPLLRSL